MSESKGMTVNLVQQTATTHTHTHTHTSLLIVVMCAFKKALIFNLLA